MAYVPFILLMTSFLLEYYVMSHSFFNVINKGVVFGIGGGVGELVTSFLLIGLVLLLKLIGTRVKTESRVFELGKAFIIAGGIANIYSRLRYGGVVDYLFIGKLWFNLNDLYVITGSVLLAVFAYKQFAPKS